MRLEHRISLAGELFRQARRPRREHAPAKDGRRRMLVIRLDRIGDFALYLPFAAALRRAFPPESCEICGRIGRKGIGDERNGSVLLLFRIDISASIVAVGGATGFFDYFR